MGKSKTHTKIFYNSEILDDWKLKKLEEVYCHFKRGFGITSGRIDTQFEFPVYGEMNYILLTSKKKLKI